MKRLAIVSGLALTLMSGAALAQSSTSPTVMAPNYNPIDRVSEDRMNTRMLESEEYRQQMVDRLVEEDPERVDLARRVALLTDEGRCREARALANAEGDRQMALRVRQTCRQRAQ